MSIELPFWAWALALLIEQIIFTLLSARIKRRARKEIAQMLADAILRERINARARQLSVKAGWDKRGKTFITGGGE